MIMIKRDGRKEEFDLEKLGRSLALASDDIRQPLTQGDVNNITREVEGILQGKTMITSHQVYIIVVGVLYVRGMKRLLEHYTAHAENAWRKGA